MHGTRGGPPQIVDAFIATTTDGKVRHTGSRQWVYCVALSENPAVVTFRCIHNCRRAFGSWSFFFCFHHIYFQCSKGALPRRASCLNI